MNNSSNISKSPRTFAIGDIHGCADLLNHLLDWIKPTSQDTFIFLGDMIDRGSDSKGVLDSIMSLKKRAIVICILGNHEQMMLDYRFNDDVLSPWLRYGGSEALASFGLPANKTGILAVPDKYITFLESFQDYHETETHIFCHATPRAETPINQFSDNDLRWRKLPKNQTPHVSNKTIICGHSEQRSGDVFYQTGLVCIDTYAYGGGWLTALEINTETENYIAWQVNRLGEKRKAKIEAW